MLIAPFQFTPDDKLVFLDQRRLPWEERYVKCSNIEEVATAIKEMVVRGAPAIGIAAALGLYLGIKGAPDEMERDDFLALLRKNSSLLASTRPTAVNLFWALKRMKKIAEEAPLPISKLKKKLRAEALRIWEEDIKANKVIGSYGAGLFQRPVGLLTHCNAGALATGGYGTALGVIRRLNEMKMMKMVYVDETRPLLQGARLTAWELMKERIRYRVIVDNMAGHLISKGKVDGIVVGADRIADNGDVANKIGTYTLAVLAHQHSVPFLVAAPTSTIDPGTPDGASIPIEERGEDEVLTVGGEVIAPQGARALNSAFDITPAELVGAIITDAGVLRPPFRESIRKVLSYRDEYMGHWDRPGRNQH